ncbi:MAG: acetolactate synthase small subunit [Firmicutes bacterium]|nr:acetolactate synthase small subunit [Bacillota bacterium]
MNRHVLSILVDNNAGVLSRIAGLFTRRGYNISSLSVGETQDEKVSRITIVVFCDDLVIEQIVKQVDKLVDVIRVIELNNERGIFRELALIKVSAPPEKRADIINIVDIFRANIVDVATETLTIEITGEQNKIEAFKSLIADFGIKEIVRTGMTGLCRGNNPIKNTRN